MAIIIIWSILHAIRSYIKGDFSARGWSILGSPIGWKGIYPHVSRLCFPVSVHLTYYMGSSYIQKKGLSTNGCSLNLVPLSTIRFLKVKRCCHYSVRNICLITTIFQHELWTFCHTIIYCHLIWILTIGQSIAFCFTFCLFGACD